MGTALTENWAIFRLALQFLTRLPLPTERIFTPARMALTPRWYGGAGAVVGAIGAAVYLLAMQIWPSAVAALAAVIAGLVVTGGLHEDGLADTFDGLGGGRTAERAMEIMRDSRIGSYGALALMAVLALRVTALASLPVQAVPLVLVAGHAVSRVSMVTVMAAADYLRATGAGSAVAARPSRRTMIYGAATTVAVLLPLPLVMPGTAVLTGLTGLFVGHIALRRWVLSRLGGYTGDCLGAVQQATEAGFLLGLLAWL